MRQLPAQPHDLDAQCLIFIEGRRRRRAAPVPQPGIDRRLQAQLLGRPDRIEPAIIGGTRRAVRPAEQRLLKLGFRLG
jgi:hypothetical protein